MDATPTRHMCKSQSRRADHAKDGDPDASRALWTSACTCEYTGNVIRARLASRLYIVCGRGQPAERERLIANYRDRAGAPSRPVTSHPGAAAGRRGDSRALTRDRRPPGCAATGRCASGHGGTSNVHAKNVAHARGTSQRGSGTSAGSGYGGRPPVPLPAARTSAACRALTPVRPSPL